MNYVTYSWVWNKMKALWLLSLLTINFLALSKKQKQKETKKAPVLSGKELYQL